MLCQGLAEHLLASFLHGGLLIDDLPRRISFAETLRRCLERNVISEREDLRRLMDLRNPLSHFRNLDDAANLSRRALASASRRAFAAGRDVCHRARRPDAGAAGF